MRYAPDLDSAAERDAVSGSSRRRQAFLVGAIVVLGVCLRLAHFLARRSLWGDEASIALNIATRGFGELTEPLSLGQTAPLLFLWLERVMVATFGVGELQLRVVPLLCGLALPGVTWAMARRVVPEGAAIVATFLVAISPLLQYFSNELKPYGIDAFVTVVLMLVTHQLMHEPDRATRWPRFAIVGGGAVWLSATAIIIVAGCLAALIISPDVRAARRWKPRLALASSFVMAMFVASYLAVYRAGSHHPYLRRFWEPTFLHGTVRHMVSQVVEIVGGLYSATLLHRDLFEVATWLPRNAIVGALILLSVAGLWRIARTRGVSEFLLLAAPALMLMGAYVMRLYPASARLLTFLSPVVVLATACGMHWLCSLVKSQHSSRILTAATGVIAIPALFHTWNTIAHPYDATEHPRPIMPWVHALRSGQPQPVYVAPRAAAPWLYYSTNWSTPDTSRLAGAMRIIEPPYGPAFANHASRNAAVDAEGDTLVLQSGRGAELYATFSGMEYRPGAPVAARPDSGWSANEVRRIRAAASPCIIVFESHGNEGETKGLWDELGRTGARLVGRRESGLHVRVTQVCW